MTGILKRFGKLVWCFRKVCFFIEVAFFLIAVFIACWGTTMVIVEMWRCLELVQVCFPLLSMSCILYILFVSLRSLILKLTNPSYQSSHMSLAPPCYCVCTSVTWWMYSHSIEHIYYCCCFPPHQFLVLFLFSCSAPCSCLVLLFTTQSLFFCRVHVGIIFIFTLIGVLIFCISTFCQESTLFSAVSSWSGWVIFRWMIELLSSSISVLYMYLFCFSFLSALQLAVAVPLT